MTGRLLNGFSSSVVCQGVSAFRPNHPCPLGRHRVGKLAFSGQNSEKPLFPLARSPPGQRLLRCLARAPLRTGNLFGSVAAVPALCRTSATGAFISVNLTTWSPGTTSGAGNPATLPEHPTGWRCLLTPLLRHHDFHRLVALVRRVFLRVNGGRGRRRLQRSRRDGRSPPRWPCGT